jgi:hypothetical protein
MKFKEYELKDHIGNVRVTFSDLKLSPTTGGSQPYVPDIRSVNNYYA